MTSRMQQGERSDYTFMAQLGTMMKLARPFVFSIKPGSCADEKQIYGRLQIDSDGNSKLHFTLINNANADLERYPEQTQLSDNYIHNTAAAKLDFQL